MEISGFGRNFLVCLIPNFRVKFEPGLTLKRSKISCERQRPNIDGIEPEKIENKIWQDFDIPQNHLKSLENGQKWPKNGHNSILCNFVQPNLVPEIRLKCVSECQRATTGAPCCPIWKTKFWGKITLEKWPILAPSDRVEIQKCLNLRNFYIVLHGIWFFITKN